MHKLMLTDTHCKFNYFKVAISFQQYLDKSDVFLIGYHKCYHLFQPITDLEEGVTLTCVQCKEPFSSAWDLMVHVQAAHMLNIYELAPKEDRFNMQDNDHKVNIDKTQ